MSALESRFSRIGRALATAGAGIAIATAFAPSAGAQDPPLTAADEYGFVEGWAFAKAHPPVNTVGLTTSQARDAILNAPTIYQAGVHPDASTGFKFRMPPGQSFPLATKDIMVDGPPGFVGSTTAVPVCPFDVFMQGTYGNCPALTQVGVGVATVVTGDDLGPPSTPGTTNGSFSPIVKLPPPPDAPARFGYRTGGGDVLLITPRLRSDGDYGLRLRVDNLFNNFGLLESVSTLWGNPYDPIHDSQRFSVVGSVPASATRKAFLTNPTYCDSGPLERKVHARSWKWLEWDTVSIFGEQAPDQCDKLEFGTLKAPVSLTLQPDRHRAGQPAGLEARLRLPFDDNPTRLARPTLRSTTVEVAEGVTVNPSAASGLEACSEAQIGLKSLEQPRCPDASKLATVKVTTPLLAEPLDGSMFLAEQDRNPFNSTMAMYLHVTGQGVQAKVAGRVDRDPVTGQITTSFNDNPQLPFTELDVRFKGGDRAPVVMPTVCGQFETKSTLTPWSAPHSGPPAFYADRFRVDEGPNGTACVSDPSQRGFTPTTKAGLSNPVAGRFSPFVAHFTRTDAEQEFDRIEVKTPKGLTGKLKGIPYCSEAGIAQAIARDDSGDGARERENPSCPTTSRVARTEVGVGAGRSLFYASGDAYLAGPYKGSPLSMVFVVPAVAGPFDLGVQVVRTALHVDRRSAQITAVSDEIPKILEGIPLRIRDIRVIVDRPDFTLNPTDCSEMQVATTFRGAQGGGHGGSSRFQTSDCAALPFKPRLSLALVGKNQRTTGRHPGINAVVKQAGVGEAGIRKAVVRLPKSLALDVNNAQALCEFEDGTKPDLENHCPKGSIIGRARAKTPLLDGDLAGDVYFVKNVRRDPKTGNAIRTLPMLVVALRGQVSINLVGESDTQNGRLVNTFNGVPDAPVNQFNMNIKGGKNGIIAVTRTRTAKINLCTKPNSHLAEAEFDGQSGKRLDSAIRMKTPCTKRQIKAAKRQAKRSAAKAKRG